MDTKKPAHLMEIHREMGGLQVFVYRFPLKEAPSALRALGVLLFIMFRCEISALSTSVN